MLSTSFGRLVEVRSALDALCEEGTFEALLAKFEQEKDAVRDYEDTLPLLRSSAIEAAANEPNPWPLTDEGLWRGHAKERPAAVRAWRAAHEAVRRHSAHVDQIRNALCTRFGSRA